MKITLGKGVKAKQRDEARTKARFGLMKHIQDGGRARAVCEQCGFVCEIARGKPTPIEHYPPGSMKTERCRGSWHITIIERSPFDGSNTPGPAKVETTTPAKDVIAAKKLEIILKSLNTQRPAFACKKCGSANVRFAFDKQKTESTMVSKLYVRCDDCVREWGIQLTPQALQQPVNQLFDLAYTELAKAMST